MSSRVIRSLLALTLFLFAVQIGIGDVLAEAGPESVAQFRQLSTGLMASL